MNNINLNDFTSIQSVHTFKSTAEGFFYITLNIIYDSMLMDLSTRLLNSKKKIFYSEKTFHQVVNYFIVVGTKI